MPDVGRFTALAAHVLGREIGSIRFDKKAFEGYDRGDYVCVTASKPGG